MPVRAPHPPGTAEPAQPPVPPATREGPASPGPTARRAARPLPLDAVRLDPAGLLGGWQLRNARATLPHCLDQLERAGELGNLRRALADPPGTGRPHVGMWFSDSDVYKTLEAAAWQLGREPGDAELIRFIDATAELLAAVQEPDGYLNSYFQFERPERRWQDLRDGHELYCAGHLIQAAVAAARAGVGARLVDVAVRFADLIVARFGSDGAEGVCGHPEIETALVELYRVTGRDAYLDAARRFLDRRGHGWLGEGLYGAAYWQDHVPVRAADEFTGHAVRQVYLLAGMVDVAVETGDAALLAAAERLWDSAYRTKTYITGAQGSRHRDEAVGDPYELPADRAYAESCAAIGSFQWNWRLLLATGRHRYADEMERVLYNAIGVSTALDGRHFFYSKPLHLRTGHDGSTEDAPSGRLPWYTCACCPPNLARLMASLQCYVSTVDDSGVQLQLYAAGTIHSGFGDVEVDTAYPWDGRIAVTVTSTVDGPWTLALRVPGWCTEFTVDGARVEPVDGYVRLRRNWSGTTRVVLDLAMPVRRVAAHHRVDAVRGCVALVRGPLVYAIEQVDLPAGTVLEDVELDAAAPVDAVPGDGAVTLRTSGAVRAGSTDLYHEFRPDGAGTADPVDLTAVPYFLWGNRKPGPMRVWLPVAPR